MSEPFEFLDLLESEERNYPRQLLDKVILGLKKGQWTISTAESLTGGLLSEALTRLPGASDYFVGGIISYSPRIKIEGVGVDPSIIRKFGVVSAPVAQAMALGIAKRFKTRIGLSTTGVAGPDAHSGMPVGTVFVGLALDGVCKTNRLGLRGDRQDIRQAAVLQALRLVWENISQPMAGGKSFEEEIL